MKVMNVQEEIPEVFYVFIGQGKTIYSQINYHNYKLTHRLVSAGFSSMLADISKIQDFIDGNIFYAPYVPVKPTLIVPSSHQLAVVNGYSGEYALERYRYNHFKTYPSRFSCLYAFGDMESCELASKWYDWDLKKVKKFQLHDFTKDNPALSVFNSAIKVCKCNMEIVTFLWKRNIQHFAIDESDKACQHYWTGGAAIAAEQRDIETGSILTTESGVLNEYLIEGVLDEIE